MATPTFRGPTALAPSRAPGVRRPGRLDCRIRVCSPELPGFQAMSVDFSTTGLQIEAQATMPLGQILPLNLHIDMADFPVLGARARVAWSHLGVAIRDGAPLVTAGFVEGVVVDHDAREPLDDLRLGHRVGQDLGPVGLDTGAQLRELLAAGLAEKIHQVGIVAGGRRHLVDERGQLRAVQIVGQQGGRVRFQLRNEPVTLQVHQVQGLILGLHPVLHFLRTDLFDRGYDNPGHQVHGAGRIGLGQGLIDFELGR
ncbi:MAG: PilZ domain-containing protein [Armatimonadetes bacterium]|nr:PilZ domain-containing protein [Armatimonadota bacterium]